MVLGTSLLMGCAYSGADTIDDLEFRTDPGLDSADSLYPGDGDIEIREGDDDDDDVDLPDIIIWDIMGGNVARQVEPGVYAPRLVVEGDLVSAASSSCRGIARASATEEVFALTNDQGQVVLTLWNRHVFVGDVDIPTGDAARQALVETQAAFSFWDHRIHAGGDPTGPVVAHASTPIDAAHPMRRLLLGALVTGECGGAGLP